MAQMTWRPDPDLLDRVRRAAVQRGWSMNEYVSAVLNAATDPSLAGDDAAQLRERLARVGLLVTPTNPRRRPDPKAVTRARRRAAVGAPLTEYVADGRR
ncbi:MAG: transcriptional regulator [Actinomycetota bacterium]|nr:transcriptional regulator [Actinomycetota bacterium]